jgi:hypothetical protein
MSTIMHTHVAKRIYEVAARRPWIQPGQIPVVNAKDLQAWGLGLISSTRFNLLPEKDAVAWQEYNVDAPHLTLVFSDHNGETLRFEAGHGPVEIESLSEVHIDEALDEVLWQVRIDDGVADDGADDGDLADASADASGVADAVAVSAFCWPIGGSTTSVQRQARSVGCLGTLFSSTCPRLAL